MKVNENNSKNKTKTTNVFRKPSKSDLETQAFANDLEFRNTLEYTIYNQIQTWKDNKISNKDLEDLDGKYLLCNLEFNERKNVGTAIINQDKKRTKGLVKGNILNPLMFSFTEQNTSSLEFKESIDDLNYITQNDTNKSHFNQNSLENSKVKFSIKNLLKLNEILRMNLESETPTVVSSSETQLELDQNTWEELFSDSNDNFSIIDFLEKLVDQITSSIKSLIMGEALLGADNARQILLFELKSLQKLFSEDKQEDISRLIECLSIQINSDCDIKMLTFKIDQIRSSLKHFNLLSRFQDFNFGYNSFNDEVENEEKILHTNQANNFFARHKFLKINKWHRQSNNPSFEKPRSNSISGEINSNSYHFFHHRDVHFRHHHILSHYKHHQRRNTSNSNENNGESGKKEEVLDYSSGENGIQPITINNDGWNIEYSKGISLSYKIDSSSNGQLSINVVIKSDIKCRLLNLLTILNEVELSNMWVPYMSYSKCVYNFSRVSKLVQQVYDLPWPIGQRENIMFCFGVDTLREYDCIMISCGDPQSSKNKFFGVSIPDPPPKIPREKCSYLLFILTPSESSKDLTTLEMFSSFCITKYVPIKLASFLIKRMTRKMYTDITTLASNLNGSPYEAVYNNNLKLYSWLDMKLSQHYESKQRKN